MNNSLQAFKDEMAVQEVVTKDNLYFYLHLALEYKVITAGESKYTEGCVQPSQSS